MQNHRFIVIIISSILSFTVTIAQNDRKTQISKKPERVINNLVSLPGSTSKGNNSPEKISYTKEVFDKNSFIKVKSSQNYNKPQKNLSDNLKSGKGTEVILTEDFESIFPGLTWDIYAKAGFTDAYWIDTDYKYFNGTWSCWCAGNGTEGVLDGLNYPNNMEAWMIFGPFDLSDATAATLSFENWLDTESDYDYFKWMASLDGINFSGGQTSGNSSGWVSRSLDFKNIYSLGDITGKSEVWIAFLFTSDESFNYIGSYIDDVLLEKTTSSSDLTWTNMGLNATAWSVGGSITVDLTEYNSGTGTAGAHSTRLYISSDNIITSTDTQLGTDLSFNPISGGSTQIQSKSFIVPEKADGTYYVGAIVDYYNTVSESDETNNANYRTGQVTISHAALCPAPVISSVTQTTCTSATGSVSLSGLPSTGTWTLTRTPGGTTTTGTGTTTLISGLAAGTYSFTVTNSSGCTSPSSNYIIINVQPVVPAAPVANSASGIASTTFTATWTGLTSATGYKLDVATNSGFTVFVADYNNKDVGDTTSRTLTGLSANTPYYYRVRAYSTCGNSSNSNTITVTTLQNPPPAPVVNQATAVTQTAFTFSWTSSATATGYRLDISNDEGFSTYIGGYEDKNLGNVTSFNLTTLSPGKKYYYRVRAYNSGGSGENSNILSVTTLFYPPLAPEVNLISALQTSFNLGWNGVETAAGYKLDVATNNTFTVFVTGYNDKDIGNITTFEVTGLSPKTTYYCRLRAYNSGGTSPISNTRTVTTLTVPPPIPTGVSSSSCNDLVTLKWRKNTGPDFQRYHIFGGTTANPTDKIIESAANASDTVKIITGLIRGQTYYFRITAVNYDGAQSDFSEQTNTTVKTGVIPKIKVKWNDVLICYNLGDSIKSYQWFNGNALLSGATNQYYKSNKTPGNYKVEIIDLYGCKNTSAGTPVSGISNINTFPNPTTGRFRLTITDIPEGKAIITIINQAGFKIAEFKTDVTDNILSKEISLNNINEGVYLLQVRIDDDSYYSRIVIAK